MDHHDRNWNHNQHVVYRGCDNRFAGYMKTVILAITGATMSFIVSIFLKWLWKVFRGPKDPEK